MCNESIRRLHEMVQHTKQDAKAGLAYMKWYEIESMCREEGREEGKKEGEYKIICNMLRDSQSPEIISKYTEQPIEYIYQVQRQMIQGEREKTKYHQE